MLNFDVLEKCLGLVSSTHFFFSRKIFLVLYLINWSHLYVWWPLLLQIFDNMCIVVICFPVYDAINCEINLVFLIKLFSYVTKKSGQKFKYLKKEKWNKKHFSSFLKGQPWEWTFKYFECFLYYSLWWQDTCTGIALLLYEPLSEKILYFLFGKSKLASQDKLCEREGGVQSHLSCFCKVWCCQRKGSTCFEKGLSVECWFVCSLYLFLTLII